MKLRKGSEVQLEIESVAFKGKGVGRVNGMTFFVPGTAPGDTVKARIIKKKKNYCEAKLLDILAPSGKRITPRCRHAHTCGGCTYQHVPYPVQLQIKCEQVKDHIERIAGLNPDVVGDIIGCDNEFYYRNKMEYSFGTRRWLTTEEIQQEEYVDDSGFSAGLHAPGRYDKILDLQECHLQNPISFKLLDVVRSYCKKNDISAYDTFNNSGYMRHLVIRNSYNTHDLMVNIVTNSFDEQRIQALSNHLQEQFPEITTIVNNVNDQPNPTAVGRFQKILYGSGTITDKIGKYSFKINPNTFFQTNTQQAEKLYDAASELAHIRNGDLIYDLYCGVGTLSIFMSEAAGRVVGIEIDADAVANARSNADENSVSNTRFFEGDMKNTFNRELLNQTGMPDCIVIDPPRSGMHPDVIKQLIELKPSRIVYVSCNPSTLARDLKELSEVYHTEVIKPVDMFPQTYHIELVTRLSIKYYG